MTNALHTLLMIVLVSFLPIASTNAQNCAITQSSSNSSFPMGGLTGQTFTACETAQLESITFYYTNSNTSSLPDGMNLYVSEGNFFLDNSNLGFTELTSVSLSANELQSSFSAGATPVTVDLTDQNIVLTDGNTYGFVLENTGSNSTFLNLGNDVYAGGKFARYNTNTGAIEGDLNDLRFEISISNCIDPITALSEDFEAIPNATAGVPACWSTNTSSISTNGVFGKDESQGLIYSVPNSPSVAYIVLPEISNISAKKVSFEVAAGVNGSGSLDAKVVLYQSQSADPNDNSTNTPLDSINLNTSLGFRSLSFDMPTNADASTQGNYLKLGIITSSSLTNTYVAIDNVVLEESIFLSDLDEDFAGITNDSPLPMDWFGYSAAPWLTSRTVGISAESLQTYSNENHDAIVVLPGIQNLSQKILSFTAEVEFPVDLAQLEVFVKKSQTASIENLTPIANFTLGSNTPETITINLTAQGVTTQDGNYIALKVKNREDEIDGNVQGFVRTRLDNFITSDFVNSAPTDLTLTASPISEDAAIGTVIGAFSTTDADAGDAHTYEIIGDATIPSITVDGANLVVEGQLDAEGQNPFRFNVITTDAGGLTFQKLVEFEILDINEAPTDIGFKVGASGESYDSTFAFNENNPIGQNLLRLITVDQDAGDTHTYSLSGEDAALFSIGTDPQLPGEILLQAEAVFDFELDTLHEFIITSEDAQGERFSKEYTLSVTDQNDTPTDIQILDALAADTIFVNELNAVNDSIATFITIDQDTADVHQYEFVNDFAAGDIFTIDGDVLRADIVFDHESTPIYEVGIRTLDPDFEQTTETFVVMINDVNEAPSDLFFIDADIAFRAHIDENNAIGDSIASIGVTDPDENEDFTYELSGTAATRFTLDGSTLRAAEVFDHEENAIYTITITVTDRGGLTYSENVNVAIDDVQEFGPNDEVALFTFTAGSLIDEVNGYEAYGTESTAGSKPKMLLPEATTDRFDDEENALLFSQNRSLTVAEQILDLNQNFSLNLWFRMDGAVANGTGQFLLLNSGLLVGINDQEQLIIQGFGNGSTVINETYDQALTPEEWYMLTIVADQDDSQTLEIYLNATPVITTTMQSLNTVSQWYIGSNSGQMEFFGKMDDIAYFQKILGNTDISRVWDGFGGNSAPTDITLSANAIEENNAAGAIIGQLSTVDVNTDDAHTYSISGTDAASFEITISNAENGSIANLAATEIFDFETKSSYAISITSTDSEGLTFKKDFTITITDVDESSNTAPSDIMLSSESIEENSSINSIVGFLTTDDTDENDTHSYSLGGVDQASFAIGTPSESETQQLGLLAAASFDFEAKGNYSIEITTNDGNGGSFTKAFNITVSDVNEAPTQISLTNSTIRENEEVGTSIGYFTTTDVDADDLHTITLSGADAANFSTAIEFIEGPGNVYVLRSAEVFDFETKDNYTLAVTSSDQGGLSVTNNFTIEITDQDAENAFPTAITLSNSEIAENEVSGTIIGTLTTTDADADDTHTYSISGDNSASFSLDGAELKAAEVFDFETQSSYAITITTDDGKGGTLSEDFTITVTDVDESEVTLAVTDEITLSTYPNPATDYMTVKIKQGEKGIIHLLDMRGQLITTQQIQSELTLDLSGLSKGVYFVEVITEEVKSRNRLMIK